MKTKQQARSATREGSLQGWEVAVRGCWCGREGKQRGEVCLCLDVFQYPSRAARPAAPRSMPTSCNESACANSVKAEPPRKVRDLGCGWELGGWAWGHTGHPVWGLSPHTPLHPHQRKNKCKSVGGVLVRKHCGQIPGTIGCPPAWGEMLRNKRPRSERVSGKVIGGLM